MKNISSSINKMDISQNANISLCQSTSTMHEVKMPKQEIKKHTMKRFLNFLPSLWTLEYIFYVCYLLSVLCYGFISISAVSRKHVLELRVGPPRWYWLSLAPFYSVGYNSRGDGQWAQLDSWLWLMVIVFLSFAMGSRVVRCTFRGAGEVRAVQCYHIVTGVVYIAFIHGPHFYLPLLCVLANYVFVVLFIRFKISYVVFMTVMWISQLGLLMMVSIYGDKLGTGSALSNISWWPVMSRWTVAFNMVTLRMIAFNMDMYEGVNHGQAQQERAARKHDTKCLECAKMREANCIEESPATRCYKFRTESPRHPNEYNLLSYMAYILYIPLYISGPMSSFNAFASHCRYTTSVMSKPQMVVYALRIIGIYVTLVTMLHFAYLNAFRLYPDIFLALPVSQKAFILYFSLAFLWLKFSVVWKLGRLSAIVDGFDVPEDMRRCFSNTVSVRDFWRDWHASFNLWIVRYMYIPMGGNKKKHLNIVPIFFFIAVWHDVALHLVKWAACVVFIFVLELLVSSVWNSSQFDRLRTSPYERLLRSVGGLFTIFGLIVANLIGFSSQARTRDGHETDHAISEGLLSARPEFYIFSVLMFFCFASLGIMKRDAEAAEMKRLKKKYGLIE